MILFLVEVKLLLLISLYRLKKRLAKKSCGTMYPSGRTFLPRFRLCMRQKGMIEDWMVEICLFKMLTCTTYMEWTDMPGIDHDERNRTIEILLGKY